MRFLLIRFSSLGDVILTTVVIKNIKYNQPNAQVDILTKPEYTPIFLNNPHINQVLNKIPIGTKYDYLIDLHNNIRSNLVGFFIRAKKKLVYNKAVYERRLYLYFRKRNQQLDKSVVDRYLEPLQEIGFKINDRLPEIFVASEELDRVKGLVPEKNFIALAPGAKWMTKQWVKEQYVGLIKKITRDFQMDIVLVGGDEDIDLCNELVRETGLLKKHVINLAGKTDFRDLAAVIKTSRVLVTPDSGPLHLGWAVGSNVVALFGPTVKEFGFQPQDPKVAILEKDMECRPCSLHGSNRCKYKDRACMQRIEILEVSEGIKRFL